VHDLGEQDFAALCLRHDPSRGVHGLAVKVSADVVDLTRGHPDAKPERDGGLESVLPFLLVLDCNAALDRAAGRREREQEPVAQRLDHPAAVLAHLSADAILVLTQCRGDRGVTEPRPESGRADHVR